MMRDEGHQRNHLLWCRTQHIYAQKYGPLFVTHQIFQPIVMVESPDLARKVMPPSAGHGQSMSAIHMSFALLQCMHGLPSLLQSNLLHLWHPDLRPRPKRECTTG